MKYIEGRKGRNKNKKEGNGVGKAKARTVCLLT
jgi:hypothetical protein